MRNVSIVKAMEADYAYNYRKGIFLRRNKAINNW